MEQWLLLWKEDNRNRLRFQESNDIMITVYTTAVFLNFFMQYAENTKAAAHNGKEMDRPQ